MKLEPQPVETDKDLQSCIKQICGHKPSKHRLALYRTAWTVPQNRETAEHDRLACLGHAILEEVIIHFLFQKYLRAPAVRLYDYYHKLTQRTYLSRVVRRLKMDRYHLEDENLIPLTEYINTDILKAFIGALFLDKGPVFTQKTITKYLLQWEATCNRIVEESGNPKGKVMAWIQKNKSTANFRVSKELKFANQKVFVVSLYINNEWIANGCDSVVKNAEQYAAMAACETLNI